MAILKDGDFRKWVKSLPKPAGPIWFEVFHPLKELSNTWTPRNYWRFCPLPKSLARPQKYFGKRNFPNGLRTFARNSIWLSWMGVRSEKGQLNGPPGWIWL